MCICEYDEAETFRLFKEESYEDGRMDGRVEGREEGRKEGRKEGRVEGREEMIFGLVNDELISSEIAAECLNLPVESFLRKLQAYNENDRE